MGLLKCLNVEVRARFATHCVALTPPNRPAQAKDVENGLPLSTLAGCLVLCCYYYLQPLGDVMALRMGIEYTPLVTARTNARTCDGPSVSG